MDLEGEPTGVQVLEIDLRRNWAGIEANVSNNEGMGGDVNGGNYVDNYLWSQQGCGRQLVVGGNDRRWSSECQYLVLV